MICTLHQTVFRWSNQEECDGLGMWQVWGEGEVNRGVWWGNVRKDPLGRRRRRWEDVIKMDL